MLRRDSVDDDLNVLDIEVGEVFGVLAEPPRSNRSVLVVALTDCEVVRIPPEGIGRAIALAPDLAAALDQLATTRRRRIERVIRRSAEPSDTTRSGAVRSTTPDELS